MTGLTWYLLSWKDIIEISFFSYIIYFFSRWLIKDKKKNLLIPFYSYLSLMFISAYLNFLTISSLLINFSPAAILILIILHQETLQRNYVTAKNLIPAQKITAGNDWLDILMKTCLMAFNHQKEITIIIEQNDVLKEFITTSSFIQADITTGFLSIIIESAGYNSKKYIWLNSTGIVVAINSEINMEIDQTWLSSIAHLTKQQQESLFISQKTDAIILRSHHENRLFEVTTRSKHYEHLNAHTTLKILKKYCASPFIKPEGLIDANLNKTNNSKPPIT